MTPNHRSNDPPTSAMAGRDMESSGLARMQRGRCLRAVIETPGLTAREIEDRTEVKAHKRLPELRQSGLVVNGPARVCRISGRRAMTWLPAKHATTSRGDCA
ncbi:MAG TPA: winged helix-turn-helix domain-containing protein [Phycisphaerales bacterium]|nr:winged helix-turn-helix domain-containing protein [Phycisphaerales bacterium]